MATAWLEFAEEAREIYPPPPPKKKKNEWGMTESSSSDEEEETMEEEGDHPPNAGKLSPLFLAVKPPLRELRVWKLRKSATDASIIMCIATGVVLVKFYHQIREFIPLINAHFCRRYLSSVPRSWYTREASVPSLSLHREYQVYSPGLVHFNFYACNKCVIAHVCNNCM